MAPINSLIVGLDFGGEEVTDVGKLVQGENRRFAFQYDEDFLERGVELSPLNLRSLRRVYQSPELWGLFQDSLPESWGRKVLYRRLAAQGITAPGLLDLLAMVGSRAMGALTYRPEMNEVDVVPEAVSIDMLAQEIEALYQGEPEKVIEQLERAAGSPGGARPKVVVGITGKGEILPDTGKLPPGVGRWLIKFHGDDAPTSGMIEAAYLWMAASAGIETPETRLLSAKDGRRYLAVKRFDRRLTERVHSHTFGGLIGGPGDVPNDYSELLGVAQQLTREASSLDELFRRMLFNVVVGNRDDHEKNFTFLMDSGGTWRVSPAYDLTWSGGTTRHDHTLLIGGKGREIGWADCLAVAGAVGMKARTAAVHRERVLEGAKRWPEFAGRAGLDERVMHQIQREIEVNAARLG